MKETRICAAARARLALFRLDASRSIGAGHAYRCRTLARALRALGWRCLVAGQAGTFAVVPALARDGLERVELPEDPAREQAAIAAAVGGRAQLLVVDHYGRDARAERALRPLFRTVMVIDDLADRPHECDLLLDPTPGRSASDHRALLPRDARVLAGPRHAILRPAFAALRRAALARRAAAQEVRAVLVGLGATDPQGHTLRCLEALAAAGFAGRIDVTLGGAAPQAEEVARRLAALGVGGRLHRDTEEMPHLMLEADLAIGAGGVTTWERCCLGLPSLVAAVAGNQRETLLGLGAAGAAAVVSLDGGGAIERLREHFIALVASAPRRRAMSAAAAGLCDGRGLWRVVPALAGEVGLADGSRIALRAAETEDEALLLGWQSAPGARRFSRDPEPPSAQAHARWLADILVDEGRLLMIVERAVPGVRAMAAGMLRLDRMPGGHEVSILVATEHQGQGVGAAALRLARRLIGGGRLQAEVHPANAASRRLFAASGFALVGERRLEWCGGQPA